MAILTNSGRVAIANAISKLPVHMAWGLGDGAWVTPTPENPNATALQSEVGRRVATEILYVVPDPAGPIVVTQGSFSLSPGNAPTNNLFIRAEFAFSDAPSDVVREVAVFSDTVIDTGLPPGQEYFTPSEITDPGKLLYIEHITPIFRSPAIRENFEVVITF